jgi:hypothetical protein
MDVRSHCTRFTDRDDRGSAIRRRSITLSKSVGAALACAAALAGCGGDGGGGEDGAEDAFGSGTGNVEATTDTQSHGATSPDPSALPPRGEARVEVDGKVFTLAASGSVYYSCETGTDEIRINYQTTDGGDLAFQASRASGEWLGNVTFARGDDNYGGTLPRDGEGLAVGETATTYRGTLTHRTYSDPANTRDVEATIAVNCDTGGAGGGGEAMAEIGGRTFLFPASGAQSFECTVTAANVVVRVNRLALEDAQIEIQGTQQSGKWVGNVYVISGSDRYNATLPADGAGLEIAGTTLTFTGTFTQTTEADPSNGQEVNGSASVTCP